MSRSAPFRHKSSLTIAMEGGREFSPENKEAYRQHEPRIVASARPMAVPHVATIDISQPAEDGR